MSAGLDRRWIYLLVFLALAWPIVQRYSLPPAKMNSAGRMFDVMDTLKFGPGDIAFIAMDYGPNTIAENKPQSEVTIEHLMRRRIPFALYSQYVQADPFLKSVPEGIAEKLMKEDPTQSWAYGKDWVNFGYRPGGTLFIQSIPKAENILEHLKEDAFGTALKDIPCLKDFKSFKNVKLLGQFTGLTGTFEAFVQFFQTEDYRPTFVHGCTSITVPEAYIYLDSGQIVGLLEGIAGAAWYSKLLSDRFVKRAPDDALIINTSLGIAHLVLIGLIFLGNVVGLVKARERGVPG